jgi:hypothetical protein
VRPYLEKKPNSKKGWQSGSSSNPREFNPQYQRGKKKKKKYHFIYTGMGRIHRV